MKNVINQVKMLDMAWTSANSGFVEVKSPITSRQLAVIDKNKKVGRVQFATKLTQRDHLKLAERFRHFPEIYLRAYELFGSPESDLDFLQHYKGLKRLSVDLHNLQSVEGIQHIADSLEYFVFGNTKKKISMEFLARCGCLKGLYLEEHVIGIDAISKLKNLEELTIRSITLPNLDCLASLPKLWSLVIILGGTTNLDALARLKSLKCLELWMVKGLSDLSILSELGPLQNLKLEALKNVTRIPSLRKLRKLRRIRLQLMKGLTDLSPLLEAKSLEDIIVTRAKHLDPKAFTPLLKHPSLKAIGFGLGSNKKNQAVAAMFPHLRDTIQYPFIYR
jgi:hypothetical protein